MQISLRSERQEFPKVLRQEQLLCMIRRHLPPFLRSLQRIAYVICYDSWVSRVILRNSCFNLSCYIRSKVSCFCVYSSPNPYEHCNQACTKPKTNHCCRIRNKDIE